MPHHPLDPETRRTGRITFQPQTPRTERWSRPAVLSSTVARHRGLKSITEECKIPGTCAVKVMYVLTTMKNTEDTSQTHVWHDIRTQHGHAMQSHSKLLSADLKKHM